jgi:hypothetical protein
MGESWMVDGETLVMMMMKISSKSPSRQGARSFWFRITVSDGGGTANSIWEKR